MSIPVISEFPTQPSSLSPQRHLPQMEALIVEPLGFPSTSQNVPFSMAYSTMVNTQPANLPTNYRSLAETIGFDRPLANLIQFEKLDLSSVPNTVPHSVTPSNIPPPSTLKRPIDLAQHGTSHVQTSSSSTRNRVVTQPSQPMLNPIIMHSPIQHAVNTIATQHPVSSQVMIPPSEVPIQQPTVTVPQFAVMVPHQPQSTTWASQSQHLSTTTFFASSTYS